MDKTTEIGTCSHSRSPCRVASTAAPPCGRGRPSPVGAFDANASSILARADIIKAELEEKQFKVKLTVIDTPGFGDYVNNRDSWTPIVDFIVREPLPRAVARERCANPARLAFSQDDQHESFMRQEQQPQRGEKVDMRVHACLYFIRPTGHTYVSALALSSALATHVRHCTVQSQAPRH